VTGGRRTARGEPGEGADGGGGEQAAADRERGYDRLPALAGGVAGGHEGAKQHSCEAAGGGEQERLANHAGRCRRAVATACSSVSPAPARRSASYALPRRSRAAEIKPS
jgi:hypothetical protein